MLSQSSYEALAPYRAVIDMQAQHSIYIGMDVHAFKKVYDPIANESLNTGCGACISNALQRAYDLIKEYEGR